MERYDVMNNIKLLLNNVPLEKGGEVGGGVWQVISSVTDTNQVQFRNTSFCNLIQRVSAQNT